MICYAIKNKEGKYLQFEGFYFIDKINYATLFNNYVLAKTYCYSGCKVVKVEIREVEDE